MKDRRRGRGAGLDTGSEEAKAATWWKARTEEVGEMDGEAPGCRRIRETRQSLPTDSEQEEAG